MDIVRNGIKTIFGPPIERRLYTKVKNKDFPCQNLEILAVDIMKCLSSFKYNGAIYSYCA